MTVPGIVLAGTILLFAGAAQSAVGFGYALVAWPLLVWGGMPLPDAITLVATCSMVQSARGVRKRHVATPWRLSRTATGLRMASVVLGLLPPKRPAGFDAAYIRVAFVPLVFAGASVGLPLGHRTGKDKLRRPA